MIDNIGEEVYEEFFEQLAGMYAYSLNVMVFSNEEFLILTDIEERETGMYARAIPFLMDILVHLILNYDEDEDVEWIDEDGEMIDHFALNPEVDMMEVLSSMELLFGLYHSDLHKQFFKHKHCDLVLKTIFNSLKQTAKYIPQIRIKSQHEQELYYEQILP